MRRLQSVLWAGLPAAFLVIGLAGPSAAAVMPFNGAKLSIQLATLPPVVITADAAVVKSSIGVSRSVGGQVNGITGIPAGLFQTSMFVLPVTDPGAAPINGVQVTIMNAAANFASATGHLGGQMALLGLSKVCLFLTCAAPPPSNLSVPFDPAGAGGSATVSTLVSITAIGAPWTTGTASVGTVSIAGFKSHTATSTISSKGAIRLVTPIFVSTNIGASAVVPAFGILDLTPEPGIAAAYGVAIGTLLMLGRRRLRKR